MKRVILICSLSLTSTIAAHPIEQIPAIVDVIKRDQYKFVKCNNVIKNEPDLVQTSTDCMYVAKISASLIKVLSKSLEAEGLTLTKNSRGIISKLMWKKLSFSNFIKVSSLETTSSEEIMEYLTENNPSMIEQHLDNELIIKLKTNGVL